MNYDKLFLTEEIVSEDEKTGKKTIKTVLSPKYKDNNKKQIFSPIRNKYLDALPEEIVRQEFICKLINEYGYSLDQMDEEVKLTSSQRGTGRASADIVIWKSEEEKKNKKVAFLVIELKASELRLKVEDCYQGYNYATWSRAKLFAISNGKELQVYKTVEEELPLKLQPVNDIPHIDTILDDKKLEESLAKTKEFTGDEFAKLLHKCHNIIRNNDKLSPEASFDEISKILFIKIMYERNPKQESIFSLKQFERLKEAWNMSRGKSESESSYMQRLFEDVKAEFLTDNIFDENEKIKLRERSFEQIVKELEIYNLTSTSADVKGIAFERFLGRTFRGELGQFFTPRVLVDFIVDLLDPKENELICDPCAGSGGFLIKTFESIKQTMDTYYIELKKSKQKEIFGQELENIDDEELQKQYEAFVSIINAEQEEKIRKLSHESIFGTDANPRMARVSKMNMIMHGDGHNGIHHNDGLLNVNGIFHNRFDVIVTNPPFGTNLDKKYPLVENDSKYTNPTIIDNYVNKYSKELYVRAGYFDAYDKEKHFEIVKDQYLKEMEQVTNNIDEPIRNLFKVGKDLGSGATEVLFVERCLDLLKPGGYRSRIYENPQQVIYSLKHLKHQLAAAMQLSGAARAEGVCLIKEDQLKDYAFDKISKKTYGVIETKEKGGKIGDVYVEPSIYEKIKDIISREGKFRISYKSYAQDIQDACKANNITCNGSHGFRWTAAQRRVREYQSAGYSYEEALQGVSWEMKHYRASITSHYLGC